MEAARSLGLTYRQALRHVILPQAFKRVIPPLGNEFIAMLKDSSLVSVIAMEELVRTGQLLQGRFLSIYRDLVGSGHYLSLHDPALHPIGGHAGKEDEDR